MHKIYGYKEKDVLDLANFISSGNHKTLSEAFSEYALISGKARGTIRNLYYAIARKSREDTEFCNDYLGGKAFKVNTIVGFNEQEERTLVERVLKLTASGRSVRSAIQELSGGDQKLALRYQNKFRNAVKLNTVLLSELESKALEKNDDKQTVNLSEVQLRRLKSEINGLVDRISNSTRKENIRLRARISVLEKENKRLKIELNQTLGAQSVARFFIKKDGSALPS
jgi:hypothetical protein